MASRQKDPARKSTVDVGVVKAIGHPLRMQLLARLNERVASPVELARELDESVQLVSYHVRILRDLGFVELVSTTPRRGAIEHHYRAVRRPFFSEADLAALPSNARQALAGTTLEALLNDAATAVQEGSLDERADAHVSRTDLLLDERGWEELTKLTGQLLDRALELQAESAERLREDGAVEVRTKLGILQYPAASGKSSGTRGRKQAPKRAARTKKK